jgi:beta-glucosidase
VRLLARRVIHPFAPLLGVALAMAAAGPAASPTRPARPPVDIDRLVASMTLDEKVAMLHGASDPQSYGQAGYLPGVPRLGIPPLRLTDGPAGVRTAAPATALPAPVALASTFSPDLARAYGRVIGRDGRARHQNVILAPMVNIVRVPQGGRNFETLGEDPVLAGRLVAAEVEGIQSEGLIATVKHYALNNQENQRQSVSADADERTMHEIELPGFEAAVRAGAGAVMAAYNKVNGTYASENPYLLTDVLRHAWGFTGMVMSDWGATHSGVPALTAGLDLEMPRGQNFGGLADAVRNGQLPQAAVDTAVRRILTSMDHAGLLDASAADRPAGQVPASSPEARDLAVAGAVLLKNDGGVLPLGGEDLGSLAVMGPTARALLVGGGGSARVQPMHTGSPLDELARRAGARQIAYAVGDDVDGVPVPATALQPQGRTDAHGLLRDAPAGGQPAVDAVIDFTGANALPAGTSATWRGTITAPATGDYDLKLQTSGGRGSVRLDAAALPAPPSAAGTRGGRGGRGGRGFGGRGGPLSSTLLPTADGLGNSTGTIHFEAGVAHPILITASAGPTSPLAIRLAWVTPELRAKRLDDAVRAARSAHTAVVFAYDEGQEGRDRASLELPGDQDALIEAVAGANPRTVVVLNNGAPILMPWADRVAAILQMWYPGQEGADATAALLTGDASPGGRLPVTFPKRAEDAPTSSPDRYPGVDGHGAYSEGIFVGYRWYDRQQIDPLFPFGFGLSYTTFAYSGLTVRPAADGYDVAFTVRNTGTRAGVDVPQVYIGPPPSPPVPMAVKALAGFERVTLAPGATASVRVHIGPRDLSYWSDSTHAWTVAAGRRAVMVGASSRDIRLTAAIDAGGR